MTNNDLQNTTQKGLSNTNPSMTIVKNLLIEHGMTCFIIFILELRYIHSTDKK